MQNIEIIYLPGYGGNFLSSLFSLDPSTYPWNIDHIVHDTPLSRVENYLSRGKDKKILHMAEIKKQFANNAEQYQYCIKSTHPHEFEKDKRQDRYFLVDLDWSDFSNYWIVQSKINFNYRLAQLRVNEVKKNLQIKKWVNPKIINIDCFLDTTKWLDEYTRINQVIGLPNYYTEAEKLYNFWYNLRVKYYFDNWSSLSTQDYFTYRYQRLVEETCSAPTVWQIFYERVRDPSWPDCATEQDFNLLPTWIQQELINVFNYQPQAPI